MIDLNNKQSRDGAIAALQTLIKAKRNRLKIDQEDVDTNNKAQKPLILPKNTQVLSDTSTKKETEDEKESRIQNIQAELDGNDAKQNTLADIQLDADEIARQKKIKARKIDAEIQQRNAVYDISEIKPDLVKLMKSQLKLAGFPTETTSRVNPSYAGTKLLVPGKKRELSKQIPTLQVYLDQSGSWGQSDIEKAKDLLSVLSQMERQKLIKIKILYFADDVHENALDARMECGTSGFPKILNHIRATNPQNVMILSDADIYFQTQGKSKLKPVSIRGMAL